MNNKNICDKCNSKESENKFEINGRGYGSEFDCLNFEIYLCDKCASELEIKQEWFDNDANAIEDLFIFDYENEDKIINVLKQLPLESQERLFNKITPCCPFTINKEDWMNMYPNGLFN